MPPSLCAPKAVALGVKFREYGGATGIPKTSSRSRVFARRFIIRRIGRVVPHLWIPMLRVVTGVPRARSCIIRLVISPTVQSMQCSTGFSHPPQKVQLEAIHSADTTLLYDPSKLVIWSSDSDGDKYCSHDTAEEDNVRCVHSECQ
jgi:hypothetical protein